MKRLFVIDLTEASSRATVSLLGDMVAIERVGCRGDVSRARTLIETHDGVADAIALVGLPATLRLGHEIREHPAGAALAAAATRTPVVDGGGLRDALERWAVTLAARMQPGVFSQKRVLMVPGFNHVGLAQALGRYAETMRYADPVTHFNLPHLPGVGRHATLDQAAGPTLDRLREFPFGRLFPPAGVSRHPRAEGPFHWADVLAGDVDTIRRYAPTRLDNKTIVVESATEDVVRELADRGAALLITLMPSLDGKDALGHWPAAVVEGALVAVRRDASQPLDEDTYLDLIADLQWAPAIRFLSPRAAGTSRFAFVIHPLDVEFIYKHGALRWARVLPDEVVEAVSARMPPLLLSTITGARSEATGQAVEGYLISLGATPRQMMRANPRATYDRLNEAARMAERLGARIMGLGAFTSVVGDAGATVAHEADIAITSGNSLTVAATLEAAKQAVVKMGATDLTRGKAMVVGATGSIGAVCARLIAQAIGDIVLVSIEPEKLIELKRRIQRETPGSRVRIATRTDDVLGECDLVVTATSAFGQRVVDITRCKPGAVVCDVARPPDISEAEAALRPDVLIVESGEVIIPPGNVRIGYDIGLPPATAYACLAETCLLAMEGRFEDYTIGRDIDVDRVKEIFRLFKKHGFRLAGLRSFGKVLTDEDFARRRELAAALASDPARFARLQQETAEQLARIPARSKGVSHAWSPKTVAWVAGLGVVAVGAAVASLRRNGGQVRLKPDPASDQPVW